MSISEILKTAWALIAPEGKHCQGAPASNPDNAYLNALHPDAVSWDSCGALQKTLGALEGHDFDNALRCLYLGASRMKMGVVQVDDSGNRHQLEAMWSFAIATAENVERQMARRLNPQPA